MKTVVTIPGLGTIRNGFDGTVGWEVSPLTGARLYEGAELTAMLEQLDRRGAVRDPALFRSMETVERTEMGGQPCYRVRLVWQSGREGFDCYHVESGLMVANTSTQESPMGTMTMTTTFADFKTFGGVLMAARIEQQVMGQTQVMTLREVEFTPLDAEAFAPPAEIRALKPAGS
jgi:hypothetical protein